jgi:hypothetical protein
VSGFFETPDLIAACPYIHGGETNAVQILWQRQQRFFEQFPGAVYVESAHHGAEPGSKTGIFQWPRQHFRNKVDIRNEPLARLGAMGMWPQAVDATTIMAQSLSSIYFNTPADNDAIAAKSGTPVAFDFPGWHVAQIQQFEYANVIEASRGTITIRNLATSEITGQITMPVALYAPETKYQIDILWQGQVVGSLPLAGGHFQTLQTAPLNLRPGNNELQLRIGQGDISQLRAIFVPTVRFLPGSNAAPATPQP